MFPLMFLYIQRTFIAALALLVSGSLLSCGSQDTQDAIGGDRKTVQPFVRNSPNFSLNVRYEAGAEPYVGSIYGSMPVWSIVERNLRQILPPQITGIEVPYSLGEMSPIRTKPRGTRRRQRRRVWKESELRSMAFQTQFSDAGSGRNVMTVYFLTGHYNKNPLAMGLHFHGTPAIYVFKDVIRSLRGSSSLQRMAEQSVILHEIGHALGLVNGYVKMADFPHEDPSSPSHCSNPNCVMYKKNNGTKSLQQFLNQMGTSRSLNFFGKDCLLDLNNFYRSNP